MCKRKYKNKIKRKRKRAGGVCFAATFLYTIDIIW